MIRRCLLTGVAVAALFVLPQTATTAHGQSPVVQLPRTNPVLTNMQTQAAYREKIRQMPMLERPNRPGHFYGNTVRRLHAWRTQRGY